MSVSTAAGGAGATSILTTAAPYLAIGSTIAQGLSSYLGGKKAKKALDRERKVEEKLTAYQIDLIGREAQATYGRQVQGYASANVRTDVGSPLQIYQEAQQAFSEEMKIVKQVGASKSRAISARKDAITAGQVAGVTGAVLQLSGVRDPLQQIARRSPFR